MTEDAATVAGLSLPPKVVGKVNGHLVMKVDEVLWARKPPGEVSAVVLWWGGDEPTTFRPSDVAEDSVKRRSAGVIYEIRTSLDLFEKYLRKCGGLEIAVADKYGMPIGCVTVMDIWQMISSSPFQGYFPIVNNFGNRIGDLHVSFNLRMQSSIANGNLTVLKAPNKQGFKTKDLKRLSPPRAKQSTSYSNSKEEKTKKNEKVLKDIHIESRIVPDLSSPCDSTTGNSNEDRNNAERTEISEKRASPTSNIISQILEHGTRIRDAMTASVIEDKIQLDFKNVPDINGLSSLAEATGGLTLGSDSCTPVDETTCQVNLKSCRETIPVVKQKVIDYLSGKPMSACEEKEALAAIRNMTPTKDILESVPDIHTKFQQKDSSQSSDLHAKESSEIVTNITDYSESTPLCDENQCSFEIDRQLLSQINCLRITILSLVLNSVGIKRVGSHPKKKSCVSQSALSLQPPGVTYFVEYKFPLPSGSRPWESNVRYCSKKISDHEITFGDRTVHNLPTSWHSSSSEESKWISLVSSFSFKVCARHLHQRVPIVLGLASPDSAKPLIESNHLRHNFDLPVMDSNCLPIAQLRVCLELGRDRIHFGGLLDPENNSLGMKSPRSTSSNKGQQSLSKKKLGKSVTTVTRNISAKSLTAPKIPWQQATQADRLIKKLVDNANVALKSKQSSETSSLPSTERSYHSQTNSHVPHENIKFSTYITGCSTNVGTLPSEQFIKHELALTILQVVGTDVLNKSSGKHLRFYVTYEFPVVNALKKSTVDWRSCSTETSQNEDGSWMQSQHQIHAVIIPEKELFHDFLRQTFKYQETTGKACITFSLCVRLYGEKVQDFLVAETYLPISCLSTLEDAYKEAARTKPNFSSSSCSCMVLDLPLEPLSSRGNQINSENNGSLRVKVDYRHSVVQHSLYRGYFPGSRGDSISENIPYSNLEESLNTGEIITKHHKSSEGDLNLGRTPLSVPNWARSPDKKFIAPSTTGDGLQFVEALDLNQKSDMSSKNLHASWEPASWRETQKSAYLPTSLPVKNKVQRSVADVINETKKYNPKPGLKESPDSHNVCTGNRSPHDVQLSTDPMEECNMATPLTQKQWMTKNKADAETSTSSTENQVNVKHMSTRGTSPIILCAGTAQDEVENKAASRETKCDQKDKAQQIFINTVHQESQTTPRGQEILKKDVGTFAYSDHHDCESPNTVPVKTDVSVLPRSSIDEVETIEVDSEPVLSKKSSLQTRDRQETMNCVPDSLPSLSSDSIVDSSIIPKTFRAKVGVECALHLQSTTGPVSDLHQSIQSFVFVSLNPCGLDGTVSTSMCHNPISISPAVLNNGEPEWHWEKEVVLPLDLLVLTMKRLIFKIWESNSVITEHKVRDMESAKLIGFSTLDLTVLSAGLPSICGWYNVMDFSGTCRGQIKLSVEPLEKISEIVDFSPLPCDDNPQTSSVHSMFVAHCAYPKFPSHVTQFPDILVQRVDSQTTNQATTSILSNYELLIKHKKEVEPPCDTQESTHHTHKMKTSPSIALQRKCESTSLPSLAQQNGKKCDSILTSTATAHPCGGARESNADAKDYKDPSTVLREKLSELDEITKNFKARLISNGEAASSSDSNIRPFGIPKESKDHATCQMFDTRINSNNPLLRDSRKCGSCSHSITEQNLQDTVEEYGTNFNKSRDVQLNSEIPDTCKSNNPRNEKDQASQKQRKMWERQEDLIDFGKLGIDTEDEESVSQNEDLGEWLSESAMQHVFNPYLFNDILNSMNSSRGVTVIELDDTGTPEDSPASTSRETDTNDIVQVDPEMVHVCRNKRGDETFRKRASEIKRSEGFTIRQTNRSGFSAGDADSGVDVDLSSNFHSGLFFPASAAHHEPFLPNRSAPRSSRADVEREGSSSCSSRYHQSTVPSSASATPSESPSHTTHSDRKGSTSQTTCSSHVLGSVNAAKFHSSSRNS